MHELYTRFGAGVYGEFEGKAHVRMSKEHNIAEFLFYYLGSSSEL